jgi:hypothetical protein
MLSAAHTIISLPFGFLFHNPLMSFFAAFLMHLVCDTLLHWNVYPHQYKHYPFILVGIDVAAGLIVTLALLGEDALTLPVIAAVAGGNMPDILHAFWTFMGTTSKKRVPKWIHTLFHFHERIQRETESPLAGGISQVILCAIAILLTLTLKGISPGTEQFLP